MVGAAATPGLTGLVSRNLAAKFELSRQVQDEYALRSQERAAAAIAAGYFDSQIVPVEVKKGRETITFAKDEHPRSTSMEILGKLRPAYYERRKVLRAKALTYLNRIGLTEADEELARVRAVYQRAGIVGA